MQEQIFSMEKQANLCRHLQIAANTNPRSLAVAVQKKKGQKYHYDEVNFLELDSLSDDIAFALNEHGIKAGMKAVLMVTPSLDFFSLTFALFKAGVIPILVDPGMGVKNLKQCFIESSPDVFIGIPKAHLARKILGWGKDSLTHFISVGEFDLCCGTTLSKLLKAHPRLAPFPMVKLCADEMAAILFTSGSTGTPKGVVYTHAMFEAQIEILKKEYEIKPGERDLATFPLFSLFGPALGMASIIPDMDASQPIKACPKNLFAAIEKYHCSNMFVNPALIELLATAGINCKAKLPSIKRVISAGAPASHSAIKRFSSLLNINTKILVSYGATESLPITIINGKDLLKTAAITELGGGICVGTPVEIADICIIEITDDRIIDWDSSLKLKPYKIGEIVVKGPQVSSSYYNRESATLEAKILDNKLFRHRMGDLGYFDEKGRLWMCGRKAHRVKSIHNGEQKTFFTIPCEQIFNTHSDVKRSALVAVKEQPLLCIELNDKCTKTTAQIFGELQEIARKHPETSGITQFLVHPKFPMDVRHNAKIYREKLSEWACSTKYVT